MAKVIMFSGQTTLPIPPDRILEGAIGKLAEVVVIGYVKKTGELYLASSSARLADVNWLLDQGKNELLRALEEP